jgi:glycosyltransferase involved in cell wall biosynthesis
MRVLHINAGNLSGGVETVLVTLATHRDLCPQMESHFAVSFKGRLTEELQAAGAPVHDLGEVRIRNPLVVRRSRHVLRGLLDRERFDVAVCHSAWSQAIFGKVVQAAQIPLVLWLHDAANGQHWLDKMARRTPPDLVLCNSNFTAGTVPKLYSDIAVELLNYPIAAPQQHYSDSERDAVRDELNTPRDATVIIQVSRLEPYKGHVLHLEALGQLKQLPDWFCWQVGGAQRPKEAHYLAELEAIATRLGIADRIRFVGQRSDVPRLLAAADIHCQPNAGPEPFGITFIEALYAHLPVVTTAIGGACEIVDDSCGALVSEASPSALATSLRCLIQDRAQCKRLGGSGPSRARELCDPLTQMAKLNDVLTSLAHLGVAA